MYLRIIVIVCLMITIVVELFNYLNLIMLCGFSLDYTLIVKCELTPSGRLVDRLPYSYEWVDGVHE